MMLRLLTINSSEGVPHLLPSAAHCWLPSAATPRPIVRQVKARPEPDVNSAARLCKPEIRIFQTPLKVTTSV